MRAAASLDRAAERVEETVFRLGPITFVPHYVTPHYVGPGYGRFNTRRYTSGELLAAGAVPDKEFLWKRPAFPQPETKT